MAPIYILSAKLRLALLTFICLAGTICTEVTASHLAGADMFYKHLGGLRYRVILRVYRDCSGINLTNESLQVSEGRCGVTVNLTGAGSQPPVKRDTQDIFCDAYSRRFLCSPTVDPANPNRPSNFEAVEYVYSITLPSRKRNWCFFWTTGARPEVGNLGTGSNGNIYVDAILNNLDFDGNNSPSFSAIDIPMPYVCVGQPFTYSFNTIETDGDSVSYALEAPRISCSTSTSYGTYTPGILYDTIDPNNPALAVHQGGTFSTTFPISSWNVVRDPVTGRGIAVPFFTFNPSTGSITFRPTSYTPPANPADGANKHNMVVRITEHRRDNTGNMRVIGETMREVMITVVDCGIKLPPVLPTGTVSVNTNAGITVSSDSNLVEVKVQTCTYTTATVRFNGANLPSPINVTIPGVNGQPGVLPFPSQLISLNVTGSGTSNPVAVLRFLVPENLAGRVYEFPVRIENNDCPVKGSRLVTLRIKIVKENFARVHNQAGLPIAVDSVNLGDTLRLTAFVNRPDTTVGGAPVNYAYRWLPAPGLRDSDTTNRIVTVTISGPTRYAFRATNSTATGCTDTASVLVLVRRITSLQNSWLTASGQGIKVYPNPTTQKVVVSAAAQALRWYNAVGQEVFPVLETAAAAASENSTWNLGGFKPGIYFCKSANSTAKILLIQ